MKTAKQIKQEYLERSLPEIEEIIFPVCIKQGESYFRYFADGKFEHVTVKLKGMDHVQTSFSFGKLTWLNDYGQEIKTIIRRHGEISQKDFLNVMERYFETEYKNFFSEKEVQSENLKPDQNYFPENNTFSNNEIIHTENGAPF